MHSNVALVIAGVLGAGLLAQILGWRLRVPAIVFLLAFGLVAGPITDLVHPDDVFGEALFPTVAIAVAIILFEGSLAMGVAGIRTAGRTTLTLLTIGSVLTFAGVSVAARYVLDVEWRVAYLLAAGRRRSIRGGERLVALVPPRGRRRQSVTERPSARRARRSSSSWRTLRRSRSTNVWAR
ncbi:MAG: cation:proton antiporter [Actinomycetota bacterium]|nr:cation:proton antiporter [Actinomycetota bacterium]MDA2972793.1 cation:proton antiporter [Actinomycetota bacterium]MDA3002173.1 cation:proton antiporter [Actinomycetota bacterium]